MFGLILTGLVLQPATAATVAEGFARASLGASMDEQGVTWRHVLGFDAELQHESGAHQSSAGYQVRFSQSFRNRLQTQVGLVGESGYGWRSRRGRLEAQVGHRVVTNNTSQSWRLDDVRYNAYQAMNAGAGMAWRPGVRTTLRLTGRVGAQLDQGFQNAGQMASSTLQITHVLRPRTELQGSVSRTQTFQESLVPSARIDSAQGQVRRNHRSGTVILGAGLSEVTTDEIQEQVVTALVRVRVPRPKGRWNLSYDRSVTSALLMLTLPVTTGIDEEEQHVPPEEEIEPGELMEERVEVSGLVIRDAVTASVAYRLLCTQCQWRLSGSMVAEDALQMDFWQFSGSATTGLIVSLSPETTIDLSYRSEWETFSWPPEDFERQQRVQLEWRREMSQVTQLSASLSHSWRDDADSSYRSVAQVSLRHRVF